MSMQVLCAPVLALAVLCSSAAWGAEKAPINPVREAELAFDAAKRALTAEDWSQAELFLERTLMYAPEHAEARLELALLLARRGRAEAAEAFVESLILDPSTPAAHRARLSALRDQLLGIAPAKLPAPLEVKEASLAAPSLRFFLESSLGRSSNPLAGTSDTEVSLTFPGGPVSLPIDSQNIAAPVAGLSLAIAGPSGLRIEAQTQEIRGEVGRSSQRVLLSRNIKETTQSTVSVTLLGQKGVYGEHRFGLQSSLQWGQNRLVLGWVDEPELGRASGILRAERIFLDGSWLVSAEHERALEQGPSMSRLGLSGTVKLPFRTMGYVGLSAHMDHSGYSVYLQNNAPRRLLSGQLVLERSWPISTGETSLGSRVEGFARVQAQGRAANIGLFAYKDVGATLGIRLAW
jgi:hypothetical protein